MREICVSKITTNAHLFLKSQHVPMLVHLPINRHLYYKLDYYHIHLWSLFFFSFDLLLLLLHLLLHIHLLDISHLMVQFSPDTTNLPISRFCSYEKSLPISGPSSVFPSAESALLIGGTAFQLVNRDELVNRDPDFDEVWTHPKRDPNGQFVTFNLQTGGRLNLPKL